MPEKISSFPPSSAYMGLRVLTALPLCRKLFTHACSSWQVKIWMH